MKITRKGAAKSRAIGKPAKDAPTTIHKAKGKPIRQRRTFGADLTNGADITCLADSLTSLSVCLDPLPQSDVSQYLRQISLHIAKMDQNHNSKVTHQMSSNFLKTEVTHEMRRVLLRWLVQVVQSFSLHTETMHLCVQIIDFMLVFTPSKIRKSNFQLLGVTSLFIASKYNEIHTLDAEKYIYLCSGLYKLNELFEMESAIMLATDFKIQMPITQSFTSQLIPLNPTQHTESLSANIRMLTNLAIFDFDLCNKYRKMHLSAVIVYFAAKIMNLEEFKSKDILQQSDMSEESFKQCLRLLLGLYKNAQQITTPLSLPVHSA